VPTTRPVLHSEEPELERQLLHEHGRCHARQPTAGGDECDDDDGGGEEVAAGVEEEVEVEEEIVCLTLLQRSPLLASLDLSNNATDAGATCGVWRVTCDV